MSGKAHIDNPLPACQGGGDIGINKSLVIGNIVNLQNYVIAHPQKIDNFIQTADTGADSR